MFFGVTHQAHHVTKREKSAQSAVQGSKNICRERDLNGADEERFARQTNRKNVGKTTQGTERNPHPPLQSGFLECSIIQMDISCIQSGNKVNGLNN